jgi:hypothetical protein
MPSSYTTNTGLEKPGDGEQAGSWGGTVNDNMDILDRALNGVGSIALSGTTHTLTTSDGVLSDGQYRVLVLGGTPSGTNTITLSPNDAQHLYFVRNNSGQSAVFTQGSGGNVTIANGKSAIIYADGGGAGAAVVDITSTFNFQTASTALTAIAALATTDNNFIVGNGSTWVAESGATARTSLGVAIGTNVQAWDANLDQIAALAVTDGNFIVGDGTAWVAESGSTARTSLGLGSIATQAANNVTISGGSITGITDLAVADGGTGASSFTANNVLLGNGTSAFQVVAPGTTGNVLTSNGTTWVSQAVTASLTGVTQSVYPNLVAFGVGAGVVNNNGTGNTFIGYDSGNDNTDGSRNTSVGHLSFDTNTTGSDNTAIGYASLSTSTSNGNTAIGSYALFDCTIGSDNCALGHNSLTNLTTGLQNVSIGTDSGVATTSGSYNVFIGDGVAENLNGSYNCVIGHRALNSAVSNTGTVAIGSDALFSTTGQKNIGIGYQAGNSITSGTGNTLLGYDVDTGSATAQDRIVIGREVSGSADDRITIGITTNKAELDLDGSDTSWAASSDSRLKTNVAPYSAGLSFINDLSVVSFNWKKKRDVPEDLVGYHADSDDPIHGRPGKTYHGFIAQDVRKALDDHPEVADGQHFWKLREDGVQTTAPSDLVPILVRAIQELSSQVALLRSELDAIKGA